MLYTVEKIPPENPLPGLSGVYDIFIGFVARYYIDGPCGAIR
jgi:hypothetical protein